MAITPVFSDKKLTEQSFEALQILQAVDKSKVLEINAEVQAEL